MEHAIGTRITLADGRVVEVVEGKGCQGCIANPFSYDTLCLIKKCHSRNRTDHKNIIYKEVKEDKQ